MKLPLRTAFHLAAGAAALTVVSVIPATLSSHEARSQTTRTIKMVVVSMISPACSLAWDEVGCLSPSEHVPRRSTYE